MNPSSFSALTRRSFVKGTTAATAVAMAGRLGAAAASPAIARDGDRKKVILQLDSIAFADDGVERALDDAQQAVPINALLLDSLWFASDVSAQGLAKSATRGQVRDP